MKRDHSTAKLVSRILLQIRAVTFSPEKPYKFSSGILSPVYHDCRVLMSFPRERTKIRNIYIDMLQTSDREFDIIGGTATAGIPHAAWVAQKMRLPMLYVRGKAKDHGKGRQVEGNLSKGQRVAIIEDLISTGGSSVDSVEAVRAEGGKAADIFSITTYGMEKAAETLKTHSVKLHTMTDFKTTVSIAIEMGLIKEDMKEIVLQWTKDPASWGR